MFSKTEIKQETLQGNRVSAHSKVRFLVKVSALSVIAFIIMFLEFAIPIFPAFLKIDLSDIPALIGAFSLGPLAGIAIELIKNLLHGIFATTTGGVGEVANFVVGSVFVVTAALVYKINKNKTYAVIGMAVGTIAMTAVAAVANYFILVPLFAKIFGVTVDVIVQMGGAIFSGITDLKTLVLYSIVPFNLLKGFIISLVTLVIYKKVSPILHR